MRILYLGLDPSRYPRKVFHYPVIRIVPIETLDDAAKAAWHLSTHMLFTSRSSVLHWPLPLKGEILAVGPATAAALRDRGVEATIAPTPTQEGVVELLKTLDLSVAHLFWPRSSQARPVIAKYLVYRKIPFYALDLYTTKQQVLEPVPNLASFDEIVFTSPTTVEAFLVIFGALPRDKILTSIGPVTESALRLAKTQLIDFQMFNGQV